MRACVALLAIAACEFVSAGLAHAEAQYAKVVPEHTLQFPADEGSHPAFEGEWWYLTGWLDANDGRTFGFQVTFFRHRPGTDETNPSRFAAKQLLFAHASLSDPARGRLLRDEKSSRAGFGLAEAQEGGLAVHIDAWTLRRAGDTISTVVESDAFQLALDFAVEQPPMLQGRRGFSQKGPSELSASYYYSLPHLRARGTVRVGGKAHAVRGVAWLDHEWFSTLLDQQTKGWDWIGLNLDDGSAIMAARLRTASEPDHWALASSRDADGRTRTFEPRDIAWQARRRWRSPRTGIEYPVEWQVRIGERIIELRPLFDDQENDARGSTGTIYWEGAVRAFDTSGRYLGRGYLELTGYGERIKF